MAEFASLGNFTEEHFDKLFDINEASGARMTLAGPQRGMVGSTACAFGRAPGDEKALYVTTDGGFLIAHESGIQDARLVRIEVGERGWPLL